MKVMIIDDEPVHVRGITKYFNWNKFGYDKVVGVFSAKEALRILQDEKVDLVITDINMPEINGLELIHRIYLLGKQPDIMIVSGYNEFTYAQEAIRLGVFAYILKPIKLEEMEENLLILTEKKKRKPQESQEKVEYDILSKIKGEMNNGEKKQNERKDDYDGKAKGENKGDSEYKILNVNRDINVGKKQDMNNDWETLRSEERKRLHPSIQKVLLYIGKNYHDELTVQDLAMQLQINESYLSVLFKREIGMNLSNYLQRYRLHRAMELLRNSDLRINEIAYRVGYQNPCYFTEQFKKIYNTTPSEIRKV